MNNAFDKRFMYAWLRNPLQTGALVPSGSALARAMAAQVEPGCGRVVELGAGTGVITRALLARGLASEQLVLVEKDPSMAAQLCQRFPQALVLHGDAARIKGMLNKAGVGRPDMVVSSLPLLSIPSLTRLRVLSQIFSILAPGGKLVQFTYSPLPPITASLATALGVWGSRVARVPWNLPPAAVWVYTQHPGV